MPTGVAESLKRFDGRIPSVLPQSIIANNHYQRFLRNPLNYNRGNLTASHEEVCNKYQSIGRMGTTEMAENSSPYNPSVFQRQLKIMDVVISI